MSNQPKPDPGRRNMTRRSAAPLTKHKQASGWRWLTALLFAAISLSAGAEQPQTDPAAQQHRARYRGGVGGAGPAQTDPTRRSGPPLACLGEQICGATPADIPSSARETASQVLEQVYALPDEEKRYFLDKRRDAVGFAIFPNVQRQGFMVASVYGKGILSYRDNDGGWSPPILLTIKGQSTGPQFGAQSSNVIFIFNTRCGIKDFLSGHHHILTHPSGPVVEHVEHEAEPLSVTVHSFDRGGMLGQSSDTFTIQIDEEANAALYGVSLKPGCIVEGMRSGFKTPLILHYFQTMQLPPGQAHHIIELK
jgi:SH3 domain-containing YSC84-like protein 1